MLANSFIQFTGPNNSNVGFERNMPAASTRKTIYLENDSNEKWLCCNYPEHMETTEGIYGGEKTPEILADEIHKGNTILYPGHYIFQSRIMNTGQLFYSHQNWKEGKKQNGLNFAIQLWNPSDKITSTFKILNMGHICSSNWNDVAYKPWEQFFNGNSKSYTIYPNSGQFILLNGKEIQQFPLNTLLSGVIRYKVENTPLVLTIYIFKDKNKIHGNAIVYPYDGSHGSKGQYSGIGNGFFYTASKISLNSSEPIAHYITCANASEPGIGSCKIRVNNSSYDVSDLADLKLLTGETIRNTSSSNNLGNWGIQYALPISFKNEDRTRKAVFEGYIQAPLTNNSVYTNGIDRWLIIWCLNKCQYAKINSLTPSSSSGGSNSWHWAHVEVKPGETFNTNYQFILGTNSSKNIYHVWKCHYEANN